MDDLRIFSADPDADASTVKIDHDSDTDASTVTINAVSGTDAAAQMSNIASDADAATVKINTASGTNAPTVKWRVVPALIGLVLALGLALFTVLVFQVRKSNEFLFSTHYERILTIIETVVYFAFFIFAWKILDLFDKFAIAGESAGKDVISGKSDGSEPDARPTALKKHFLMSWNPGSVLVTFLLLFVLFLPYMYVYYPGVSSMDTANQIKDYVTGTMPIEISWNAGEPLVSCFLNDHHPVVDTLIFIFFKEYIGSFIGPVQGVFVYCILQSALTALLLSLMLCRMEKLGIPYLYRKIGFIYLGFSPFIAMYSIGMLKDSLHSMFFIAYYLVFVLILREGATARKLILLMLLSIILCVTKKTGLYVTLICNISLILSPSVRKKAAAWAASWIVPAFLLMFLMPRVLFPMFNIFPGGKQEALGFTLQMTAQTYLDHRKELPKEEVDIINSVMDISKLDEEYSQYNYDSSKHLFRFDATDEQLGAYKKLWLKLFFRYPKSGIKALFGTAGGFFSPTERIRLYYEFAPNTYTGEISPEEREPLRKTVQTAYNWAADQHGFGLLLQCVLYMWWLPLGALIRILLLPDYKGRRMNLILCLIPIAVCVLILWVSPYSMGRYGLPQLYTLPLTMGLASSKLFLPAGKEQIPV